MSASALRPRTGTEIIDASVRLLRVYYVPIATVTAAIYLPLLLLRLVSPDWTAPFLSIASNLFQLVASGAAIVIISEGYLGQRPDVGAALRHVFQRFVSLLVASILQGLLIGVGFLLLVIPGLIFFAMSFAMPMAVVLEGRRATEAFERSRELSKGHRLRILGTLGVTYVLFFVLVMTLGVVAGGSLGAVGLGDRALDVVGEVLVVLVSPVVSVVATLLYYDLRIRKEGFDLEIMARELGAAPPAPGGYAQGTR
jgi:hypothetical protein